MHASLLKLFDNWVRTLIHNNDILSTPSAIVVIIERLSCDPFLFYNSFSFFTIACVLWLNTSIEDRLNLGKLSFMCVKFHGELPSIASCNFFCGP